MIAQQFKFEVEKWLWENIIHWIIELARGDCFHCQHGLPASRLHECDGLEENNFTRYHLLGYFHDAATVVWELIEIPEVLANVKDQIQINLIGKGFTESQIEQQNTSEEILFYVKTDRCLHKVFDDLWIKNSEPLDYPWPVVDASGDQLTGPDSTVEGQGIANEQGQNIVPEQNLVVDPLLGQNNPVIVYHGQLDNSEKLQLIVHDL